MINLNYWAWFFKGSGGKLGYKRVINKFVFVHLIIGVVIARLVDIDIYLCASTVLIPLAGIFIGLSFAWVQNVQSLLQSEAMIKVAKISEGGFEDYVFVIQTSILTILITLVTWGFAGLKIFDNLWPTSINKICYFIIKSLLFGFSSLTLRECWHVIMGVQWMLIIQNKYDEVKREREKENH